MVYINLWKEHEKKKLEGLNVFVVEVDATQLQKAMSPTLMGAYYVLNSVAYPGDIATKALTV